MKPKRLMIVLAMLLTPGILIASEHFDGTWHTKVVCPPKGNTEGFTWTFDSLIENGNLRGVRGVEGQPGSFVLTGKVADDGSASSPAMASSTQGSMPVASSRTKASRTPGM